MSIHQNRRVMRALGAVAISASAIFSGPAYAKDDTSCLFIENGKIHTMNGANSVVSSVRIEDGKFAEVGGGANAGGGCRVINLRGRTAVPGMIDVHNHIILLGLRPGHDVRLEFTRSIPDVIATLAAKAKTVPAAEWITSLGGFNINQWTPFPETPRFPTLAELDQASSDHPIFMMQGFTGPGATNSLGKQFFTDPARGANVVTVGDDGSIVGTSNNLKALFLLRDLHKTLDDQKRALMDAMAWAAFVGVTTHLDQGGFPFADTKFENPGSPNDGLANFDRYRAYDALQALHDEGKLINRFEINFLHLESDPATPELLARLQNVFPLTGDKWLQVGGIGEFTALGLGETWQNGTRLVAQHGWRNENHTIGRTDFQPILDFWEQVNQELKTTGIDGVINPDGITKLRWVLAHVPFLTRNDFERLKALGAGVNVPGGWRWLSGTAENNGPPFRTILDTGIHVAAGGDGMQISVLSPFINMFYMVTGRNARGVLINPSQQITREEAIRLYTSDAPWFLGRQLENKLGTIETGKFADMVVLSSNYFDPGAVPDDKIVDITSVLTIVNGKIVFGDPSHP